MNKTEAILGTVSTMPKLLIKMHSLISATSDSQTQHLKRVDRQVENMTCKMSALSLSGNQVMAAMRQVSRSVGLSVISLLCSVRDLKKLVQLCEPCPLFERIADKNADSCYVLRIC